MSSAVIPQVAGYLGQLASGLCRDFQKRNLSHQGSGNRLFACNAPGDYVIRQDKHRVE